MYIEVISKIKPKNNGGFSIIDACDVSATPSKRLTTVLEELSYFVTPEQFGAVGDGVTDDTDAVLSAIRTNKTVVGTATYRVDFGGSLYSAITEVEKLLLNGGTYLMSGRINFSNDLQIDGVKIIGDVWFVGKDFEGDNISITNSSFDVGELTFRLNNQNFKNVYICNNNIHFYGAFWSSTQTSSGTSKGNVYIRNNEFAGKTIATESESYYCACVVENDFVEFSGNYCHDFVVTSDALITVHDGYFSSKHVYVHDNTVINMDSNNPSANALMKSKSYGTKHFSNNYYEINSDSFFPIIQVQADDSEWTVTNCVFKVAKCTATDIKDSDRIMITGCRFEIGTLNAVMIKNSYKMTGCDIRINTLDFNYPLSIKDGYIYDTKIYVDSVSEDYANDYGAIFGYSSGQNKIKDIDCNIPLIYSQFYGTIENCELNWYSGQGANFVTLGQLINCVTLTRYFQFRDGNPGYTFDLTISGGGYTEGYRFTSDDTIDYISPEHVFRINHQTARRYGSVTCYKVEDGLSKAMITMLIVKNNENSNESANENEE